MAFAPLLQAHAVCVMAVSGQVQIQRGDTLLPAVVGSRLAVKALKLKGSKAQRPVRHAVKDHPHRLKGGPFKTGLLDKLPK